MSIIYQSACDNIADFQSINGSGVTVGDPTTGYVGKSLKIDFDATAYLQQSVRIALDEPANVFQTYIKIPSTTSVLNNDFDDMMIIGIYHDQTYNANPAILQLKIQGLNSGFVVRCVDPFNNYEGDYGNDFKLDKDVYHRFAIERTETEWKVYWNKSPVPILTYIPKIQPDVKFSHISIGTESDNVQNGIIGTIYFDQILAKTTNTVSTFDDQLLDNYEGIQMRYFTADGAVVRPIDPDGTQLDRDVIAKGLGHGLLHAVQNNDKVSFGKIDNWARANIDRRNSTVANTILNPTPTTGLNLMCYKYLPNTTKPIADSNFTPDSDIERAFGLLLASQRWGSSFYPVDSIDELASLNYYQRALDIISDLRQYAFKYSLAKDANYILVGDFQTANIINTSPDYNYTAAYEEFARMDNVNSVFWQKCIKGAYDLQDQMAGFVFAPQTSSIGLNGAFCTFDLTTGLIFGDSAYGSTIWGYESFRVVSRMLDHWNWYKDKRALVSIQKPKTFLQSEWQKKGRIEVGYTHDGVGFTTYQATLFYAVYSLTLSINDQNNNIAKQIYDQKLNGGYSYSGNGSYFNEVSFFDDFWQGRIEAQRNCRWLKCNKVI
jgi:endo-1,4-beta-D-glucanase Y